MSTAHVNDRLNTRETIRRVQRFICLSGHPAHGVVENLRVLRILAKEFPHRHAKRFLEGDTSGPHAMEQLAPGRIVLFSEFSHGKCPQRYKCSVKSKSRTSIAASEVVPAFLSFVVPGSLCEFPRSTCVPHPNGLSIEGLCFVKNFGPFSVMCKMSSRRTPNSP